MVTPTPFAFPPRPALAPTARPIMVNHAQTPRWTRDSQPPARPSFARPKSNTWSYRSRLSRTPRTPPASPTALSSHRCALAFPGAAFVSPRFPSLPILRQDTSMLFWLLFERDNSKVVGTTTLSRCNPDPLHGPAHLGYLCTARVRPGWLGPAPERPGRRGPRTSAGKGMPSGNGYLLFPPTFFLSLLVSRFPANPVSPHRCEQDTLRRWSPRSPSGFSSSNGVAG